VLKSSELSSSAAAGAEAGGADLAETGVPVFAGTGATPPFTGLPFSPAVFPSGFRAGVPLFFPKNEKTTARSPEILWWNTDGGTPPLAF
jgi:hypothetical protein